MDAESVTIILGSIVSFISFCISYFGVLRINLRYTKDVDICVVNGNFWWGFNGLFLMIIVMISILEEASNACLFIFLVFLTTAAWISPTAAFLSICGTDVLFMVVVEAVWLLSIVAGHVYKKYRNLPPPMAEPLNAPVAVPATSVSGTHVWAREAEVAECV